MAHSSLVPILARAWARFRTANVEKPISLAEIRAQTGEDYCGLSGPDSQIRLTAQKPASVSSVSETDARWKGQIRQEWQVALFGRRTGW